MKNLYNEDGSLSTQAQSLLSPKPADMSFKERCRILKEYKKQLSAEDIKEFDRLLQNERVKRYHAKNPEKVKECWANYYSSNTQKIKDNVNDWRAKNHKKVIKSCSNYIKRRKAKDPLFRLKCNFRNVSNRVINQLAIGKRPAKTFEWVGCSPEELKAHIESLFQEGMTWDNYGKCGWHIDHIRPISSFKPEEWEQVNHYTNLQPLWAEDNYKKGDKY